MDSLKSHKKQRISRRSKQVDEFEQKLKEFFGEIQSHKYHMDGLRWLVSLYNNHLSGILADEMGLGKTVQRKSSSSEIQCPSDDNNLEELWSLLNFLLPNIFNSSEDFSQWFNKPFESNGSSSPDEALLSEEENLLITNRLHQVLRPFVLRRLKEKVENELPEKIERLVRCEASAYQKLLMKRVQEHLGGFGTSKVHDLIPKHYLPNFVRLCGKLEMLDRLLPKLKATDHRVLLFSTMTRLLDVMEDYLGWKQYRYLRLDGHTPGGDRGGLIDQFNEPDSPYFVFLLSIRAGGVGVNLQAADTVQSVEEQVRAAAEHKLGVANQSITAGFFDNSTSAEDRREYLESLLRECKKEEVAPVLHDDALNDLIARSESEIDIFQSIDQERQEEDMTAWKKLASSQDAVGSEAVLSLPARLLTDDDLRPFCEAMKISDAPCPVEVSNDAVLRKSGSHVYHGNYDTHLHGRGKRVRCYDEQWTGDHFEDLSQVDSPESPRLTGDAEENILVMATSASVAVVGEAGATPLPSEEPQQPFVEMPREQSKEFSPPSRRGRGRPKKATTEISASPAVLSAPYGADNNVGSQGSTITSCVAAPGPDSSAPRVDRNNTGTMLQYGGCTAPSSQSPAPLPSVSPKLPSASAPSPPISIPWGKVDDEPNTEREYFCVMIMTTNKNMSLKYLMKKKRGQVVSALNVRPIHA
ncbi:hypothetical protein RJ640_014062 [Escallonia rubra]|uniref:Helicase C-terminal domain-containing protein n=1 Tax=Escallonia rubra TaxID=112253 RepID=A0AA88R590_9ASTE|nr:hypothetical protein RJ640_014062 [Escallonia rubra]